MIRIIWLKNEAKIQKKKNIQNTKANQSKKVCADNIKIIEIIIESHNEK